MLFMVIRSFILAKLMAMVMRRLRATGPADRRTVGR
jgi:hypothetical protein